MQLRCSLRPAKRENDIDDGDVEGRGVMKGREKDGGIHTAAAQARTKESVDAWPWNMRTYGLTTEGNTLRQRREIYVHCVCGDVLKEYSSRYYTVCVCIVVVRETRLREGCGCVVSLSPPKAAITLQFI